MLYVVRHLRTSWNKKWLFQWWKSWHIHKASYEAIKNVVIGLQDLKIDFIVSSDLYRAKKTAQYLKKKIGYSKNTKYYSCFREINFWKLEWKPVLELSSLQENIFLWNIINPDVKFLEWESIQDLLLRIQAWLDILKNKKWNILIVTHSYVIRSLFLLLKNENYEKAINRKISSDIIYCFDL
jgi:broad specificity phosphatase PhoE